MDKLARKWFDQAYEFSRKYNLSFSFFTGLISREELSRLLFTERKEVLDLFLEKNRIFYASMPSEPEFKEEKTYVLKEAKPLLKKFLSPLADTLVYFGSVQGDIDLAPITNHALTEDERDYMGCPPQGIMNHYPIFDWTGLNWFQARNGRDLVSRLILSRQLSIREEKLPPYENHYIEEIINRAQILWGDPNVLKEMCSCRLP